MEKCRRFSPKSTVFSTNAVNPTRNSTITSVLWTCRVTRGGRKTVQRNTPLTLKKGVRYGADSDAKVSFHLLLYFVSYYFLVFTIYFGVHTPHLFIYFIPNDQNKFLHLVNRRVRQGKRLGLRPQRSVSTLSRTSTKAS